MFESPQKKRRSENIAGNIFVDESCINCDTCRWMAPDIFTQENYKSAVTKQPDTEEELHQALSAMVSCPTGSIRTEAPEPKTKQVIDSFPQPVSGLEDRVLHCGYHSHKSFGATSYLALDRQNEGGPTVMIESPRFNRRLGEKIKALGAPSHMFLSHIDDVADHLKWREFFPDMKRIVHRFETEGAGEKRAALAECELILDGEGPWEIQGVGTVIYQPGHTKGHLVLLRDDVLYTGDHIAVTRQTGHLASWPRYNWHSWAAQVKSVQHLYDTWPSPGRSFRAVLPGHGRKLVLETADEMRFELYKCLEWMQAQ